MAGTEKAAQEQGSQIDFAQFAVTLNSIDKAMALSNAGQVEIKNALAGNTTAISNLDRKVDVLERKVDSQGIEIKAAVEVAKAASDNATKAVQTADAAKKTADDLSAQFTGFSTRNVADGLGVIGGGMTIIGLLIGLFGGGKSAPVDNRQNDQQGLVR